ncbi:Hypothetical_protein [Hexamita inflata]|uniref:Hypothetical_protein n=1 Tax=Hexamita inflata TaxID=28002 RepID=A0AA86NX58_9EUKA|nr:Hypothetical protein HINF_LOCUS14931 [Hexamita inflata]
MYYHSILKRTVGHRQSQYQYQPSQRQLQDCLVQLSNFSVQVSGLILYLTLTQQQNVQIAFQRKATPQNRKQDNQFMTLFPGLNLDQIRNNANTITRNSPTQPKAVINKKISKTNSISTKELTESL